MFVVVAVVLASMYLCILFETFDMLHNVSNINVSENKSVNSILFMKSLHSTCVVFAVL